MLYSNETWSVKLGDIYQLVVNDNAVIRLIYFAQLCERMLISDLKTLLVFQILKVLYIKSSLLVCSSPVGCLTILDMTLIIYSYQLYLH